MVSAFLNLKPYLYWHLHKICSLLCSLFKLCR